MGSFCCNSAALPPPTSLPSPDSGQRLLLSDVKHAIQIFQDVEGVKKNLTAEINAVHLDTVDDCFWNFQTDATRLHMVYSVPRRSLLLKWHMVKYNIPFDDFHQTRKSSMRSSLMPNFTQIAHKCEKIDIYEYLRP
jgi:hypothetical protein